MLVNSNEPSRYKIIIEYVGTNFAGWQRQNNALSIQELIEEAVYKFSHEKVTLFAAGRTDAGVHAIAQVAHFDLSKKIEPYKIINAANHFIKPYVSIIECQEVSNDFHARFSAKMRHYLYRIVNRPTQVAVERNKVWWIKQDLDIELMKDAANCLVGNHNFSSFRAKHCQAKSPVKTLTKLDIVRSNFYYLQNGFDSSTEIRFYLSAPSFLYHMVRNIVGSLVLVGMKKCPPEYIGELLRKQDRQFAGPTAPAEGLYFLGVDY